MAWQKLKIVAGTQIFQSQQILFHIYSMSENTHNIRLAHDEFFVQ
jgi:hypothetical protein